MSFIRVPIIQLILHCRNGKRIGARRNVANNRKSPLSGLQLSGIHCTGVRKPGNICITNRHDMTLAVSSIKLQYNQPTNTPYQLLTTLRKEAFENILGNGENACYQHFLLFSKCCLPFPKQISNFRVTFILLSASALNLDQSKILSFGKELTTSDRTNHMV